MGDQALTVETLFKSQAVEIEHVIHGKTLSEVDQTRMVTRAVADVARQLLSHEGVSPVGLSITVAVRRSADDEEAAPDLVICGTAPLNALDMLRD